MAVQIVHERFYFDDGNVVFLVEETLFNVHRYFLKRESPVFRDMFTFTPDSDGHEGSSNEHPVVLEGTKSLDFACLLACLYPLSIIQHDDIPYEHWNLVLDLAVKWQFNDVRDLAVMKMKTHASPNLALQVAAARKHNIEGWYFDSFVKLCERGRPITPKEGDILGILDVIRLSAIRTKLHRIKGTRVSPSIYNSLPDIVISHQQRKYIAAELDLPLPPTPAPSPPMPLSPGGPPNGWAQSTESPDIIPSLSLYD